MIAARRIVPQLPYLAAIFGLLGLLTWILAATLPGAVYSPTSDDGYYLHFASVIERDGLTAFPGLFAAWNSDSVQAAFPLNRPSHWHPPPYRIAFILVSALFVKAFGASLTSLSIVSAASHVATTWINWFFARRHMGEGFALALAAVCGFSPLLLGLGTLALMDSFACLGVTLATWLFFEALKAPRSVLRKVWFGVAFALAILTKELSVLCVLPFAACVLVERFARGRDVPLVPFALALACPGLATMPPFVLGAGGLAPLLETVRIVLTAPRGMPYAIENCSGPWYRYLIDYFCLSPFSTLCALFGVGALLQSPERGAWPAPRRFFALFGALLLLEHAFLIKNVRYLVALDMPMRLLALAWLFELAMRLRVPVQRLVLAAVVGASCLLDFQSFRHFWVDLKGYDPVSVDLLRARDILPRH